MNIWQRFAPDSFLLIRSTIAVIVVSLTPSVLSSAETASPRILSAFFGLDNALPRGANILCPGAAGQDGMPVVLSHTVDQNTLQAEDFRVYTRDGVEVTPHCFTLRPATDPGEHRTVLLIGEFGDAKKDPPAKVLIVGDILSDGSTGNTVNFNGTETDVIPLEAGPTLILAEVVAKAIWTKKGRGSACPADSKQVIRATWTRGIRSPGGNRADDDIRTLYRVTVRRPDGSHEEVTPMALAELGDNDNNHFLCLDTNDPAVSVAFPAGHFVDPNQDLNPATQIVVTATQ